MITEKQTKETEIEFKKLYPGVKYNLISGNGIIYIEGEGGQQLRKDMNIDNL